MKRFICSVLVGIGGAAACAPATNAVPVTPTAETATAETATNAASVVDAPPAYVPPVEAQLSDTEIWNRAYDRLKAGDTNAVLAALKPFMLSRTHGARAAEVVGALEYANMKAARAEDPEKAAAAAEAALAAMQIALRAAPDDPRANRNFTRAADPVNELRETAHVAKVLKEKQGQSPDQLLAAAVREIRDVMTVQKTVLTNAAAVAVRTSEALARRVATAADVWIPVKQGVIQSVTNEQQAAVIVGDVEAARDATKRAADLLDDLSPDAAAPLAQTESALNRFWKMTILPPAAVDQDILCQSNAFLAVAAFNGRPWQPEALDFTRAFRAKFPAWAQQYEQQAQADTNKPPFTKEQQAEIAALATEVEKIQIASVEKEDPPQQEEAIRILLRIRELLPKDNSGQNGGNPPPQANPQQNPDNKPQPQNSDGKDEQQQDQKPEQPPPEQPQQDEQKAQDGGSGKDDPKDDKEIEALLRKAQERSDEHEAEKKARMNRIPPSANQRDW